MAGDYFGRTRLRAGVEPGTLKTLTDVSAYEIDDNMISSVLGRRPIIAEKLAETFTERERPRCC